MRENMFLAAFFCSEDAAKNSMAGFLTFSVKIDLAFPFLFGTVTRPAKG
jgi:hypothetical protein